MMRYKLASTICVAGALALGGVAAHADALYVKGDAALLADGDLYLLDLSRPAGAMEPWMPASTLLATIGGATDVAVAECKAVVKGDAGVVVVSLSQTPFCDDDDDGMPDDSPGDDDCKAVFDPAAGGLLIPCIEAGGQQFRAILGQQRGNSMNWELKFLGEGYAAGDDDYDDQDDLTDDDDDDVDDDDDDGDDDDAPGSAPERVRR